MKTIRGSRKNKRIGAILEPNFIFSVNMRVLCGWSIFSLHESVIGPLPTD